MSQQRSRAAAQLWGALQESKCLADSLKAPWRAEEACQQLAELLESVTSLLSHVFGRYRDSLFMGALNTHLQSSAQLLHFGLLKASRVADSCCNSPGPYAHSNSSKSHFNPSEAIQSTAKSAAADIQLAVTVLATAVQYLEATQTLKQAEAAAVHYIANMKTGQLLRSSIETPSNMKTEAFAGPAVDAEAAAAFPMPAARISDFAAPAVNSSSLQTKHVPRSSSTGHQRQLQNADAVAVQAAAPDSSSTNADLALSEAAVATVRATEAVQAAQASLHDLHQQQQSLLQQQSEVQASPQQHMAAVQDIPASFTHAASTTAAERSDSSTAGVTARPRSPFESPEPEVTQSAYNAARLQALRELLKPGSTWSAAEDGSNFQYLSPTKVVMTSQSGRQQQQMELEAASQYQQGLQETTSTPQDKQQCQQQQDDQRVVASPAGAGSSGNSSIIDAQQQQQQQQQQEEEGAGVQDDSKQEMAHTSTWLAQQLQQVYNNPLLQGPKQQQQRHSLLRRSLEVSSGSAPSSNLQGFAVDRATTPYSLASKQQQQQLGIIAGAAALGLRSTTISPNSERLGETSKCLSATAELHQPAAVSVAASRISSVSGCKDDDECLNSGVVRAEGLGFVRGSSEPGAVRRSTADIVSKGDEANLGLVREGGLGLHGSSEAGVLRRSTADIVSKGDEANLGVVRGEGLGSVRGSSEPGVVRRSTADLVSDLLGRQRASSSSPGYKAPGSGSSCVRSSLQGSVLGPGSATPAAARQSTGGSSSAGWARNGVSSSSGPSPGVLVTSAAGASLVQMLAAAAGDGAAGSRDGGNLAAAVRQQLGSPATSVCDSVTDAFFADSPAAAAAAAAAAATAAGSATGVRESFSESPAADWQPLSSRYHRHTADAVPGGSSSRTSSSSGIRRIRHTVDGVLDHRTASPPGSRVYGSPHQSALGPRNSNALRGSSSSSDRGSSRSYVERYKSYNNRPRSADGAARHAAAAAGNPRQHSSAAAGGFAFRGSVCADASAAGVAKRSPEQQFAASAAAVGRRRSAETVSDSGCAGIAAAGRPGSTSGSAGLETLVLLQQLRWQRQQQQNQPQQQVEGTAIAPNDAFPAAAAATEAVTVDKQAAHTTNWEQQQQHNDFEQQWQQQQQLWQQQHQQQERCGSRGATPASGSRRGSTADNEQMHELSFSVDGSSQLQQQGLAPPDLAQPDLTQPDLTWANIAQPDLTQPDLTQKDLAQPDLTPPGLSPPDLTQSDLAQPLLAQPHLAQPDLTQPDLTQPFPATSAGGYYHNGNAHADVNSSSGCMHSTSDNIGASKTSLGELKSGDAATVAAAAADVVGQSSTDTPSVRPRASGRESLGPSAAISTGQGDMQEIPSSSSSDGAAAAAVAAAADDVTFLPISGPRASGRDSHSYSSSPPLNPVDLDATGSVQHNQQVSAVSAVSAVSVPSSSANRSSLMVVSTDGAAATPAAAAVHDSSTAEFVFNPNGSSNRSSLMTLSVSGAADGVAAAEAPAAAAAEVGSDPEAAAAANLLTSGNAAYTAGDYAAAAAEYRAAMDKLGGSLADSVSNNESNIVSNNDSNSNDRTMLFTKCSLNLACCHLRLGQYKQCLAECDAILYADPSHVVALCHRGRALLMLQQPAAAKADLQTAEQLLAEEAGQQQGLAAAAAAARPVTPNTLARMRLNNSYWQQRVQQLLSKLPPDAVSGPIR